MVNRRGKLLEQDQLLVAEIRYSHLAVGINGTGYGIKAVWPRTGAYSGRIYGGRCLSVSLRALRRGRESRRRLDSEENVTGKGSSDIGGIVSRIPNGHCRK